MYMIFCVFCRGTFVALELKSLFLNTKQFLLLAIHDWNVCVLIKAHFTAGDSLILVLASVFIQCLFSALCLQ